MEEELGIPLNAPEGSEAGMDTPLSRESRQTTQTMDPSVEVSLECNPAPPRKGETAEDDELSTPGESVRRMFGLTHQRDPTRGMEQLYELRFPNRPYLTTQPPLGYTAAAWNAMRDAELQYLLKPRLGLTSMETGNKEEQIYMGGPTARMTLPMLPENNVFQGKPKDATNLAYQKRGEDKQRNKRAYPHHDWADRLETSRAHGVEQEAEEEILPQWTPQKKRARKEKEDPQESNGRMQVRNGQMEGSSTDQHGEKDLGPHDEEENWGKSQNYNVNDEPQDRRMMDKWRHATYRPATGRQR